MCSLCPAWLCDRCTLQRYRDMDLKRYCKRITAWKVSVFGVFLVRIFPHSDWIQRGDTEYLPVFSPNAGKYRPEKLRIRTLFMQCILKVFSTIITKLLHLAGITYYANKFTFKQNYRSIACNSTKSKILTLYVLILVKSTHLKNSSWWMLLLSMNTGTEKLFYADGIFAEAVMFNQVNICFMFSKGSSVW